MAIKELTLRDHGVSFDVDFSGYLEITLDYETCSAFGNTHYGEKSVWLNKDESIQLRDWLTNAIEKMETEDEQ